MTATKQLRDEHEGIKLMLTILEKVARMVEAGGKLDLNHIEHMLEFFRIFVDKCHHGKEEDLLFRNWRNTAFGMKEAPLE